MQYEVHVTLVLEDVMCSKDSLVKYIKDTVFTGEAAQKLWEISDFIDVEVNDVVLRSS